MNAIRDLNILDGPTVWVVYGATVVVAVYLLWRRPTRRRVIVTAAAMVAGALLALGVFLWVDLGRAFGMPLPISVAWWAMAAFALIGLAVVNLRGSRWWRKAVAGVGVAVFAVMGVVGVNGVFGLDPTVGALFGTVSLDPIALPAVETAAVSGAGPLYRTWKPPATMPATGTQGTQVILGTVSGFQARPAGIYLPPAALVPNAPPLPLVIMMMGYPGNPDPSYAAAVLDNFAASHHGLAPIVVVADQIGTHGDPACADSTTYGKAETYIKTDVVNWAKANLHISRDPKDWVIAGYSNGGGCAIKYGAQRPDLFKNIIDIAGEEFPGSEDPDVVAQVYGGDQAAFEASKPLAILAANTGKYEGVRAIFTVGGNDPDFIPAAQKVSAAASAAGMDMTYDVIPGAGHVVDGLNGGLAKGLAALYPTLGLSAP